MNPTLLIVDDSADDQASYRRALRDSGLAVTAAATVAAGLTAMQTRPAVVLLDYNLPDGDGLEFLRRATADDADAPPIVMLTGSGNESVAVEAMKAGAYDYLIKDVDGRHLKLLPAVIERVRREWRMREEKAEAERQLRLAANVYHNVTEGIVATDADGTIVSVNPAFCAMTGYAAAELVGASPRLIKSNRHGPEFYQAIWDAISQDGAWQGDIWNRRKDGRLFLAHETITAIREGRRVVHYVGVMRDVTESRQAEEFVRHQAYHDPLTALPNRSLFMDRLRQAVAHAHRYGAMMALMFIDLDRFKPINDEFGHEVGDELLRAAAARLAACVRESDTVARLGGDEFTAVLNDLPGREAAARAAQKILDEMCRPFPIGGRELCISASIGVALYPVDGDGAEGLLKAADDAMYAAKRGGRAAYVIAPAA